MPTPLFIAAGHNGMRLVSEDGATWKNEQLGKDGEVYRGAAVCNGWAVAVGTYGGNNIFAATRDGTAWKTGSKDGKYANYVRGLATGKDTFLAVGGDPGSVGSSRPFVLLSPDGVTWTDFVMIPGKNIIRRVAFGNGLYVGVGDRGRRAASADGKDWKDAPGVKAIDTLVDIAFGAGVFVGVGLHGLRMSSKDGLIWTDRQTGEEGEHLNSVVFAGGRFVAVGTGATWFSPDGLKWERKPNKDAPQIVAFGNGAFVGAKWKGRILRSTDALEWREVRKCEHHVEAVAFGPVG